MYRKIIICVLCSVFSASVVLAMGKAPQTPTAEASLDFSLEDINGKTHTLSDHKGKVVFLNFWATWCPPCRAEMPSMQRLYKSWDKKKFVMLAVDVGESRKKVKTFVEENGYAFPVLLDSDSKVSSKYGIRGIPTTFLMDKEGNIITKIVGAREWSIEQIQGLTK